VDGSPPSSSAPRRRRKRGNRAALILGLVLVPLAMLAGLELALRAGGLGDLPPGQASKLSYQQVYPPMLQPGQRPDGSPAWISNDARVPWQALDRPKAPGGLRVVVVGGSATAGLGFSLNVTFARELQRMLQAATPGRQVELLNLGIVALGSSQVRWIVDDVCRRLEPDVVLVYSGNNEFLEIHAAKFAAAGEAGGGLSAQLNDTNLFRLLGGLKRSAARGRDVTVFDMASAKARVSETEMMRTVTLSADEHAGVVDTYERNLRAMQQSAAQSDTELVLMTVASNWQWQGRHDLPEDWIAELLGAPPAGSAELEAALALAEAQLSAASERERHRWLFKRGLLQCELSRWDEGRQDLRAAMNADPRLRRATDELAERVRAVAADTGTPLLDTIEQLAARSAHGIVGDDVFYDYVHFSPRGTVLVAAAAYQTLRERGLVQPVAGFELAAHTQARLAWYAGLREDPLAIDQWLGIGDLELASDRDLWKHQAHVRTLDALIAELTPATGAEPTEPSGPSSSHAAALGDAHLRRANAAFFMRDGYDDAVAGYEAALALLGDAPDSPIGRTAAANLQRLQTTRRP